MRGRKDRTPKTRAAFLDSLGVTCSVQQACDCAGISKSTVYQWRSEDVAFKQAWDEVIAGIVEEAHGRILRDARDDDGPAGVASRVAVLRAHMPETFNRGLSLRHEMMRLQIEERRQQLLAGPPMIEGRVEGSGRMVEELQAIQVIWSPWNGRVGSVHLPPTFDLDEFYDENGRDTPLQLVPIKQDGSGLRVPLPSECLCETHGSYEDGLPAT
jgi:hypothetical protein